MNLFSRLITRLFSNPPKPEIYIGETILFDSGQRTLERYGDFKEIGEWGCFIQNEKGEWVKKDGVGGRMMSETVKFVGKDGAIKLGRDWVAENL